MPQTFILLKEETRMLGAAQIMIGLIHSALGHVWTLLYMRQLHSFSKIYRPFVLLSGYPFWSFVFYVISGTFAVKAEKEQSLLLMKRTLRWTIGSLGVALIGLFLIIIEITSFLVKHVEIQWPQRSGMMLSVYLWIFGLLEMCLANIVVKWLNEAFYRNIYSA
uniref:membrane-spanning 4-domains subfamily A member 12-like isoform X1 n=1 Tax=Ictidomys tridecemlineatus TaxID=43179 RepID=UPI001A9D5E85|nr:membrane-spanning 4-domains subfamily A member 12-like isoform X1 [Ictidomys tridecemlineatus]XP_040140199.1 membrane-spanning 4-domains subfamily A member 12-like isoform X1 [Ictidomys tridecemlineatus]XP_040140200.1 membrane-spanning 4-domains subfamily A member 12-like isoform X1 [Ictidomys tridecemlineatus]XP_040140201.1 membrane-spanning 4-domains subfamily A member 12-like isoform X1 [Ictidomys tridecemlineatus]